MSTNLAMRLYHGEDDLPALAAIFTASENADHLALAVSPEDLAGMFAEVPRLDLFKDLVIAEVDEQAVGFGHVRRWKDEGQHMYGLTAYVTPKWRRQGVGRALLGWLEEHATSLAAAESHPSAGFFHVNATQYQVGLHALVEQAGYQVKESWVLMVRLNLEDIPDIPLPAGLELRPYRPEQLGEIWYSVCEAYVPLGGSPPTYDFPADFQNSPTFQPELWQVAWEVNSSKVVGSVMTYINHAENKQMGILRGFTEGISTVPAWQHRGVARALIARSLKVLHEAGMTEAALVCSGESPYNLRLYTGCGFQEVKRDTVYTKPLPLTSA